MKNLLLFLALSSFSFVEGQAPQFVSTAEYVKYTNWNPAFVCQEISSEKYKLSEKQKDDVSNIMQQFSDFNQYVTGLCEARAHYISLKSAEAKVSTFKIWLFAQNKFSVFGQGLSIKSKPGFYWQYHVATAAFDSDGKVIVFDPIVNSTGPVLESDWLNAFNAPYSLYFYTCPGYYLFNSGKPGNVSNDLFNGAFWLLTPKTNMEPVESNMDNVSNWLDYVSIRLAANDLASRTMISKNNDFYNLVNNYNSYKNWFVDDFSQTFPEERKLLKNYQEKYANNLRNLDPNNFKDFYYFP